MRQKIDDSVDVFSWKEAKATISAADPEITKIIDEIAPDDRFKLFRIRYPYGAIIYEEGQFFVPSENGSILPLTDAKFLPLLQKSLSYRPVPLGCITHNSIEVFKQTKSHIFPIAHRRGGLELGVWESVMPASPFTVTSGARFTFMLPKVNDTQGQKKLKRYGIKGAGPVNHTDQWAIFRDLANHPEFSEPWHSEVFFFSNEWYEKMHSQDPVWMKLYIALLLKNIKHTEHGRIKTIYDNIWENFSLACNTRRIKASPHIFETFKHLIFIATGILPGFKTVKTDSIALPVNGLMKIYLEDYGLKNYIPTMLYPDYFKALEDECVYYSLQIPTSPNAFTKNKNSSTVRSDMIELVTLIDHFFFVLNEGHLGPGSEYIYSLFGDVQFDYFHSEAEEREGIATSTEMPSGDPGLLMPGTTGYADREFCARGTFVRGCVRISKK